MTDTGVEIDTSQIEIVPTYFEHGDIPHAPTVPGDSAHTVFTPVPKSTRNGRSGPRDAHDVLLEMQDFAARLQEEINPGILVPQGKWDNENKRPHKMSIGELIDTNADEFIDGFGDIEVPDGFNDILVTAAKVAELSGFDRDKAVIGSTIHNCETDGTNVNLHRHSDGLSGMVKPETISAKRVRFVYGIGPGTRIDPALKDKGIPGRESIEDSFGVELLEDPSPLDQINAPRFMSVPAGHELETDAQQVIPGRILGFDTTRTFSHKAVPEREVVLVIDVYQHETADGAPDDVAHPRQEIEAGQGFCVGNPQPAAVTNNTSASAQTAGGATALKMQEPDEAAKTLGAA